MKRLYFIKEAFYDFVTRFPTVLLHCEDCDTSQLDCMLERIYIQDVMESASVFFQKSIVMEDCTLYMEQNFHEQRHQIECNMYYILFDKDANPFVELLKRKFRHHFIIDDEIAS